MDDSNELCGLEAWAERWLELSVIPNFKDLSEEAAREAATAAAGAQKQVSVRAYLSSPKVAVFNQVCGVGPADVCRLMRMCFVGVCNRCNGICRGPIKACCVGVVVAVR